MNILTDVLTDDLRRAPWRGDPNPLAGHCYIVAEAIHWFLPSFKPQFIRHEGQPHWFLREESTGQVVDPTASQFSTPVPYEQAKGKGFLTKRPSRRAQVLINRLISRSLTNQPFYGV